MSRPAIQLEGVSKRYTLGASLGGYITLREVLASRFSRGGGPEAEHLWALRDVSFEVDEGEALGVIGPNGAGKSTLLKVLARITQPTAGVSRTRGRVGSLLDVGSGFHPELNGRENVYLNGAILGMRKRDIKRRFDEIVDFAGLERFLETPLKRYSWGMYLRLAFSIAAHLEADVLIVDEVLAVGDARFRDKCLSKMSEFGRQGKTVVFVSHDLGSVSRLCRRTAWLEHGHVQTLGPSDEVIEQYLRASAASGGRTEFEVEPGRRAQLLAASVESVGGDPGAEPQRDLPLTLSVRLAIRERIPGLDVALALETQHGVPVLSESWGEATGGELTPGEHLISMTMPPVLPAGEYVVGVWLGSRFETVLDQRALGFRLWPRTDDESSSLARNRLVQPGVEWSLESDSERAATGA